MTIDWTAAFDAVEDAICLLDSDSRVLRANRAATRLFGCGADDMAGRPCWEIVHGTEEPIEDCPAVRMRRSLKRERQSFERDGRWLEVTVDPVLDAGGRLAGAVHVLSDVTERKLAEDALRESEDRFRDVFAASNVGKSITYLAGELEANAAFAAMLGYTPEEFHKLTWRDVTHPDDVAESQAVIDALLEGRSESVRFSKRYLHRDGSIVWADVGTVVRRDVEGAPLYFITTVIDVTERKTAEDRLVESERKYRALFENMNAGFVLFEVVPGDNGGPVDLVIVAANAGFGETTGLDPQAVLGRRLTEALPGIEKDEADWIGTYGRIALEGGSLQFEQGSELLGYVYSVMAYHAGPGLCAVTFRDITERRRAERERDQLREQLHQSQKLESIGRLAGGVAHDFNNMLSIIIGYGETLLEQLREGDPLRHDIEEIVAAGHRSASLTHQLLAFSRKQPLKPAVLQLTGVLEGLDGMLRRLIGEDVQLDLVTAPDLPCVLVDPGQIEQVIMNLAINARDAMPSGGKLMIETALTELDETYAERHAGVTPGPHVMMAVSDTGGGMDEETRSRIFEPFFTTKARGRGTGLGLATVYGIVKQSGGHIWVYSEIDRGTTFKIYFPPAGETPAPAVRASDAGRAPAGGETLLVVEDEESLRRFLRTVLPRLGYEATVVANAGEALLAIEEQGLRPDLLLTDVVLPTMSGRDLAERLVGGRPELRVLYMSGYTDNAIVHHGVLDPGTHFLQKPFTVDELVSRIQGALGDRG